MKIKRLSITNFRSIEKLDIELPQICALVGPNNAGKSNILLAIYKVLGRDWVTVNSFDENDVYIRDAERDIKISLSFDPPLQYQKFMHADPSDIHGVSFEYTRYEIGESKGQRRLEQQCFDDKGKKVNVLAKAPQKGEQRKYQPLVGIPSEVKESVPLIYIGTNRSLKEQLPGARYSLLRQLFEDINKDFHSPSQTVQVEQADDTVKDVPKSEKFYRLLERAMGYLRTDSFIELETSIKKNALRQLGFDPDVDTDKLDFYFAPFDAMEFYKSLDLRVKEGDFHISATELGEGIQNALVLSILQAFEERRKKGAILLIEEPEMFLHPQMQRALNKTLWKIGESNQIIYTTHSPHFVSVPDYHEVLLVRKGSNGSYVTKSNLPSNTQRREKLIKELDPERNELFFASRLLLVEGDTEKLALPEYAKRLNLDLDREGATIVEVGGKRNLPEFADVATSFSIPTGVVYDIDSSDFGNKDDEKKFNKELDDRNNPEKNIHVWALDKKYEDHLKKAIGDKKYAEACQKYPNTGKPTKARLIAMEHGLPIPEPIEDVLKWLANKEANEAEGQHDG
ncbi:MAG TPA: ATP-dependent nuclease [Candidatus Tripitaka californicus]|uniref:ATP-dependent nuclease n=1 Tax=Candidatus Tripitaka californicus TaxID=3367616 RepID=UPI004024B1A1|nr:AAA family ATPase [Planctomycetota bacterium]